MAEGRSEAPGLARNLESVSAVVAPLSVLTALLFYVGWTRTRAYFSYFGVDAAVLELSPQDYVLRSAGVSLGAVAVLVLAAAVLLAVDRACGWMLRRAALRHREKWARQGLIVVGSLIVLGGLAVAAPQVTLAAPPPVSAACLVALGAVLLLRYRVGPAGHRGRRGSGTTAMGFLVLALSGFWAATVYAQYLGTAAAQSTDTDSGRLPVVTVYSTDPLDLAGTYVQASKILVAPDTWKYRYSGASLLTYSNERWFLITGPASPDYRSVVVVLRDAESIHVDTAVPRR